MLVNLAEEVEDLLLQVGQSKEDPAGDAHCSQHLPQGQELHLLWGGEGGLPHVQEPASLQPCLSQGDKVQKVMDPTILVQVVEFAEFHFQLRFLCALLRFRQVTQKTDFHTRWKLRHGVQEWGFGKFFSMKDLYQGRSLINTEEADKICSERFKYVDVVFVERFKDKRILKDFKPGSGIDQQRRDRGTFFKPAQLSLSSSGDLWLWQRVWKEERLQTLVRDKIELCVLQLIPGCTVACKSHLLQPQNFTRWYVSKSKH